MQEQSSTNRICEECGEPFIHRPGRGSANQRFHNQRCQQKNYRRLHPDMGKASRKARDKRNRKKLNAAARVYRAAYREKINAAQRARYDQDPEKYAARARELRKQNPRHHAIQRAWRRRNKDKVKAWNARSRAKLKAQLAKAAKAEELELLVQGQAAVIRSKVNQSIRTFQRLFSLPAIKQNPMLLLDGWTHPTFSKKEVVSARAAVIARARNKPSYAAQYFVSDETHMKFETVSRYYRAK
jgi:hypothetical protein